MFSTPYIHTDTDLRTHSVSNRAALRRQAKPFRASNGKDICVPPLPCLPPATLRRTTKVRSRRHPVHIQKSRTRYPYRRILTLQVGWRSSICCADEPTNERSAPCLADADCPAIDPDIPTGGSEESTPSRGECFWSCVLFEDVRLELLR